MYCIVSIFGRTLARRMHVCIAKIDICPWPTKYLVEHFMEWSMRTYMMCNVVGQIPLRVLMFSGVRQDLWMHAQQSDSTNLCLNVTHIHKIFTYYLYRKTI